MQRGSPESKELDKQGSESDEEQKIGRHADESSPRWARVGGLRTHLYSNSLLTAMGTIWLLSWFGQSVTGRAAFNEERIEHHQSALDYTQYLGSATSGSERCRTGNPSSWPWARWRSSPSTCASVARRSRSPSASPTSAPE